MGSRGNIKHTDAMKPSEDYSTSLFHATNKDTLQKILTSGKIKTLAHIAKEDPDLPLSVELSPIPVRKQMQASKALDWLSRFKTTDRVFFTRGGVLTNYGDYVVAKKLQAVAPHDGLNSIPNEYITKRPVSVRHKSKIFVPDEELSSWKDQYPNYKFHPKSEFKGAVFGFTDRARALYDKLTKTGGSEDLINAKSDYEINRLLKTRTAYTHGSGPLGTALGDSDIDITVPYKNVKTYQATADKFKAMFPELQGHSYDNKVVYKGNIAGKDVDLSVTYGPKAEAYRQAYRRAKTLLTPERQKEIRDTKRRLKDAWIFPKTRYNLYKRRVADELGLREYYF